MSDALVDFFAKKDKKKKLTKSSLESRNDSSEPFSDQKCRKEKGCISDNFKYLNDNVEEWHDFEENREKDYSGLKIQNLPSIGKDQILLEQKVAEGLTENQIDNAWASKSSNKEKKIKEPEIEPEQEVENPQVAKKYIPPSLRSSFEVSLRSLKKAPEISNKSEFPTLGG